MSFANEGRVEIRVIVSRVVMRSRMPLLNFA
jgi:hypothetical protein